MLILKVLSLEPAHGYGIAQRVQQISRDAVQLHQGSLYPALHRLERQGWLKAEWRMTEWKQRAKFYSLTPKGKRQLVAERSRWEDFRAAIEQLPGRKLILTNGSRKHAENVARKIGILDHFEDVFDIAAANLDPKPLPQVYDRFLARHGVDAARAAMFASFPMTTGRSSASRSAWARSSPAWSLRPAPRVTPAATRVSRFRTSAAAGISRSSACRARRSDSAAWTCPSRMAR